MSWELQDDEVRKTITEGVAPPSRAEDLLENDSWAGIFSMWATDLGFKHGDYTASRIYEFWRDYRYGTDFATMREKYLAPGNPYGIEWPQNVLDRFERVDAGMEDPAGALAEMRNAAIEKLEPYLSAFGDDIHAIQSTAASEPTGIELTRDRIDQSLVDSINQDALKNAPAAEGLDSFVEFWMRGDLLLIGENHPGAYLDFVKNGGVRGRLYMNSKGGAFSRGEILVQGISSSEYDAFKTAIRRFSQKKVTLAQL